MLRAVACRPVGRPSGQAGSLPGHTPLSLGWARGLECSQTGRLLECSRIDHSAQCTGTCALTPSNESSQRQPTGGQLLLLITLLLLLLPLFITQLAGH